TVFLAASLTYNRHDRILDMGAGTGGILSCLLARTEPKIPPKNNIENNIENIFHGIEVQPELLALARRNARENGFIARIEYFAGDIANPPPECDPNSYHHVVSNPPYLKKDGATASPYATKARAHMARHIELGDWVRLCLRMLKPLGYLTLVQRADRMDDIIAALHGKAGDIIVFPLWSTADKEARRIIIQARKGAKGNIVLKPGLIIHTSEGGFTPKAEAILRHGAALDITQ
ncbi:MAG: methyltransferase domain-containing protein, partial [Alphaproteobacteria bacterium]|nr:methyltransferase domain-containing protein [Alphaproteobacteria bacterium]